MEAPRLRAVTPAKVPRADSIRGRAFALELVAQLPADSRLDRARSPRGQPWRLVAFAYVGQLATLGALLNVFWQYPRLLAPTLALAIGVLLWRVVPDHVKTWAPIRVVA